MNIGFFSETYTPDINGVVTSIQTFRAELEAAGHNVYVFAPATELFSRPSRRSRERGVYRYSSFAYPFYRGYRLAVPFNPSVQRQVSKLQLDVVHSHTPFSLGLFATMVAKIQGVPHIHTYHTLYPEYAKLYFPGFKRWNERGMKKISAVFCNATDHVIAPSEGIKAKLVEYGISTPITTVSTGVPEEAFRATDPTHLIRRRYGIPAAAPLVLTVARLGKEKSLDYLLRAFVQIGRFHPDAYYLVLGDGPHRLELETLAKELGINQRVIFAGTVTRRADVLKAYATADLFLFASRTDTQCMTMLEAAAAGLPLVARHDAPLETALRHEVNGFFVQPDDDPHKFAWKAQKLLGDKALAARYGKASVTIAREQSAANRTKDLVAVYAQAISGKQAEPTSAWRRLVRRSARPDH